MFEIDLLIAFVVMSSLFIRQIMILKEPNKINYAPLMLSIGAISGVLHFIIHPETSDFVLLLRTSFVPFLVSLILYFILNILHQTQLSINAKAQEEFSRVLVEEVSTLKRFMLDLEARMQQTQEFSLQAQEDVRKNFLEDIKILDTILKNQQHFSEKFDQMQQWHDAVDKSFHYFSEVQLPELDNVVHKHIDILRIAEQDHYNKIKLLLEKAVESRYDLAEDLEKLKAKIDAIKGVSEEISTTITTKTVEKLAGATKAFESEIVLLKSHTESLKTSLNEAESRLGSVKHQSELIMKQMVLSATKMDELEQRNKELHHFFVDLQTIVAEVENIKSDYIQSQHQLHAMIQEMQENKTIQFKKLEAKIENLTQDLSQKIDTSLEKLHEHYHITSEDISQSVKILAKKAQSQKGYLEN